MLVVNKRTGQVEEFSTIWMMNFANVSRGNSHLAVMRISWAAMYIFTMKLLQKNLRLIKEENKCI